MSALVLPLHPLLSYPHSPQSHCHLVPWGFCPLSSSLLLPPATFLLLLPSLWLEHRHSLLSQASCTPHRSGLAFQVLTGDTKESRRMAVTPSPLPQFCINSPPKEREGISSISCSYACWLHPFQRQMRGKQSGTQRSPPRHAGKLCASLRCVSRSHCILSRMLFVLEFMINNNLCCKQSWEFETSFWPHAMCLYPQSKYTK